MAGDESLSASELASLREIGRGPIRRSVPDADEARLVELGMVYRLLGDLQITSYGQALISRHPRQLQLKL